MLLIAKILQGNVLTAYDCEDEGMRFDLIDLTEPKPCPEPSKDFEPSQSIMVQVIQTDTVPNRCISVQCGQESESDEV